MFIVVASFSYFKCKYSSADQTLCNQSNILLPLKQKTHLSCLNLSITLTEKCVICQSNL
jgi:hypothetical protein